MAYIRRNSPMKHETLKELRAKAKARGLKGYSKLTKEELIARIGDLRRAIGTSPVPRPSSPRGKATPAKSTTKSKSAKRSSEPANPGLAASPSSVDDVVTEELVESAKYTLHPARVLTSVTSPDLGEEIDRLPVIHEPMVCLLAQKPGVLHAYWSLPPGEAQPDVDYKLRLYRTDVDGSAVHEEIAIRNVQGNYYFHVSENTHGHAMAVQLGYYEDGQFVATRGRSSARLPSLYASSRTDHRWWISDEDFARLYQRAGGQITPANRYGWSASISSASAPPPPPDKQMSWPGGPGSS